ncbi:MAG: S49 family peptidase [Rhodospirillales bacterium]|nr:S49 family peptidase [Rhodospirillales bacterium]
MTDLPHIASRLFGTPLLVARPKLDVILGVLGPRLAGHALEPVDFGAVPDRELEITPQGIAILPVTGTLVSRSGYLAAASGLMSYGQIGDAIEAAAADPRVRGIVLDIDSPGGEVGGLFDLADRIAAVRQATGKPIHAVANETALSAAYAIACAADAITVTQTGEVGSVGVVAIHVDESGADRQAGLSWTFVHAGERKVDGNPHEPLSGRARADIQADVDALHERFVALVARRRNLSPEEVRATEAAVYRGDLAVRAGLADRVGTLRQAVSQIVTELPRPTIPRGRAASGNRHTSSADTLSAGGTARHPPTAKEASMQTDSEHLPPPNDKNISPDREPGEDKSATPAPEPGAPVSPAPGPAAGVEQRLRAEYAELADVAAQAARLGLKIDVAQAMAKSIRPDALRRSVLEQLAARSDAADLVAAQTQALNKPQGESPIVKRAREAASRS